MLNNYAKDYLGLVMPKLEVLYDVHWFSIFDDFSLVGFVESLQSYYHTLASLLDDKGTFPIEHELQCQDIFNDTTCFFKHKAPLNG